MDETRQSLLLRAQTGETEAWKDLTDRPTRNAERMRKGRQVASSFADVPLFSRDRGLPLASARHLQKRKSGAGKRQAIPLSGIEILDARPAWSAGVGAQAIEAAADLGARSPQSLGQVG
jgi:hypothetical protein